MVKDKVLWDGTNGFSSLSETTRKSNRLQMSLLGQHFLLSSSSVGPAGVWTCDLPLSRPASATEVRSNDSTATRASLKKWICVPSVLIAIIPTHLFCQILADPPGVEFQGTITKFRKRNKISSSLVYVLHKTWNKAFSRRSRAKTTKKCTKNWKKCDARASHFDVAYCLFWRSRCGRVIGSSASDEGYDQLGLSHMGGSKNTRADKHVRLIFNNTKFGVKITNTLKWLKETSRILLTASANRNSRLEGELTTE